MRILILGSVALPVPPPFQGGTEWMAYYQAEGLAGLGHEVTLIAARGSKQGAYRLLEAGKGDTVAGSSLQHSGGEIAESSRAMRKEIVYLSQVQQLLVDQKESYDIILNNMRGEASFLPLAALLKKPLVSVCHLPLFPELAEAFAHYHTPVITISDAQRIPFPHLNYLATVSNCVDTATFHPGETAGAYPLMMGSIARHKNQGAAIRVAKQLGKKLILAGKIGDKAYFEELAPLIDGTQIQHLGELSFAEKVRLYQQAEAFLFPIVWEEPFGLVMIEAMACGTPVVAYGNGAIPEVVADGKTGFVVEPNNEAALAEAVKKIASIKRADCRTRVEETFSVPIMVKRYEAALQKALSL